MIITGPQVSITNLFTEERREKTKSLSMDKEVGMKQYASTKRKKIQMCILLLRTAEEKLGETLLQHLICTVLLL